MALSGAPHSFAFAAQSAEHTAGNTLAPPMRLPPLLAPLLEPPEPPLLAAPELTPLLEPPAFVSSPLQAKNESTNNPAAANNRIKTLPFTCTLQLKQGEF
jgi:hypothetical protein